MEGGLGKVNMSAVVERRVKEEQWHVDSGAFTAARAHSSPFHHQCVRMVHLIHLIHLIPPQSS